ncbi:MAG: hypothetical protein ABSH39_06655 [Candidatus Acidiferrum sp.]|jgi:hypothetical protein
MIRKAILIVMLVLLSASGALSKKKGDAEQVIAEKDSETVQWTKFIDGDSHTYSDTTSYIKYRTGPHTIAHLTMVCKVRWKWDKCFKLFAGTTYEANIDYKHKEVSITGQMEGNLGPVTTFKSQAINVEYEEEKGH